MAAINPYQRPGAAVADGDEPEVQPVRIFGASGRIGRVRYIAYSAGLPFLIVAAVAVVAGLLERVLGAGGSLAVPLLIGAYGLALVICVLLTIQRCHDFDVTGWLSIVFLLVPLAVLLLWFIPGTRGANRFGPPTEPNSALAVIGALVLPLLVAGGILAAIAIPAYQDYAKRAQAAADRR
jgi:uncharacterized membrane protein YhaH (DUF805 family)